MTLSDRISCYETCRVDCKLEIMWKIRLKKKLLIRIRCMLVAVLFSTQSVLLPDNPRSSPGGRRPPIWGRACPLRCSSRCSSRPSRGLPEWSWESWSPAATPVQHTHTEKEHAEKEGLGACPTGATNDWKFLYFVECCKNLYNGVNLWQV